MATPPEIELLICCARTHIDPGTSDKIRTLVAKDIDWAYLIRKAWRQGTTPLLYLGLGSTLPRAVPENVLDTLRSSFHANAARNLFLAGELIRLVDLFDSHRIPAIAYKGPALAVSVYQNLALRQFSDLDILVHPWDFYFSAQDLLIAHGWRRISDYGWECGFVDSGGRVSLDLHQGITDSGMPFRLGFERLWRLAINPTDSARSPACPSGASTA
ncbi:MAG: nucleotidyltransferase domain-containing protein [bacterium]